MSIPIVKFLVRGFVSSLLGAWVALTMLKQITKQSAFVNRVDPFNTFVPVFRFFGPTPGMTDTHLLVRAKLSNGTLGPWREIEAGSGDRRWRHVLWAPERRASKALVDIARTLGRRRHLKDSDLKISLPYRALVKVALGVDHDPGSVAAQFALGRSAGFDPTEEPTMTFISEFHDLPGAKALGTQSAAAAVR